jgi:protein required for attachment to host cells
MVGDGEKALFLENIGDEKTINLAVVRTMEHENPPTREQGTDRPGRYNDGSGPHRSAVEDTDWHHLGKERFAKEIADRLYKAAHSGRYKHLVIAAPPFILGELRKELHKEVRDRVLLELDKELTKLPVHEIEARITAA